MSAAFEALSPVHGGHSRFGEHNKNYWTPHLLFEFALVDSSFAKDSNSKELQKAA